MADPEIPLVASLDSVMPGYVRISDELPLR